MKTPKEYTFDEFMTETHPRLPVVVKRCYIFGPLCTATPLIAEEENQFIIYVDGGLKHAEQYKSNSTPSLSVGDGDSSTHSLDVVMSPRKNFSDFEAALFWCKSFGNTTLEVYGMCEGRIDHYLALLFNLLNHCALFNQTATVYDARGAVAASVAKELCLKHRGHFSLFALKESSVDISGDVDYAGEVLLAPFTSQGLSNMAHGQLSFKSSQHLLLMCIHDT
jgi:thiamine pyrophosphokinase